MDTIGVVCEPDHPVFGRVAERLAARGFGVEFFPSGRPIERDQVEKLAALVNTVVSRRSFAALHYADRAGVETWNGFVPTTALSCRLVGLNAVERLGSRVPDADLSAPADRVVPARRFRWDGPVGTDAITHGRFDGNPTRTRYYAVDDGIETHVQALGIRSELTEHRSLLEEAEVDVERAALVRELLDRFDARVVAVDFAQADDDWYAVDVDPAPQFFAVGMERRLADSMASLTTIGA